MTRMSFYDHLSPEQAARLDRLAWLQLGLRDSRAQLLARYGAADEAALLDMIHSGAVAEHPAYQDYLGSLTIAATRERIRAELRAHMQGERP